MEINYDLIQRLTGRSHPLLNDHVCDCHSYCGEIVQEARNSHHLLDMVGVPHGVGYAQDLDARTWLAIAQIIKHREQLDRIAAWHSRETAEGGLVGDFCVECGNRWPCETRRMADGTHEDLGDRFAADMREVTPAEIAEDLGAIDRANARARETEEGRTD